MAVLLNSLLSNACCVKDENSLLSSSLELRVMHRVRLAVMVMVGLPGYDYVSYNGYGWVGGVAVRLRLGVRLMAIVIGYC